jgi:hypothetical protein
MTQIKDTDTSSISAPHVHCREFEYSYAFKLHSDHSLTMGTTSADGIPSFSISIDDQYLLHPLQEINFNKEQFAVFRYAINNMPISEINKVYPLERDFNLSSGQIGHLRHIVNHPETLRRFHIR